MIDNLNCWLTGSVADRSAFDGEIPEGTDPRGVVRIQEVVMPEPPFGAWVMVLALEPLYDELLEEDLDKGRFFVVNSQRLQAIPAAAPTEEDQQKAERLARLLGGLGAN